MLQDRMSFSSSFFEGGAVDKGGQGGRGVRE